MKKHYVATTDNTIGTNSDGMDVTNGHTFIVYDDVPEPPCWLYEDDPWELNKPNEMDVWPCMHESCPECGGNGTRKGGGPCVHNLSCPCPKCSPRC